MQLDFLFDVRYMTIAISVVILVVLVLVFLLVQGHRNRIQVRELRRIDSHIVEGNAINANRVNEDRPEDPAGFGAADNEEQNGPGEADGRTKDICKDGSTGERQGDAAALRVSGPDDHEKNGWKIPAELAAGGEDSAEDDRGSHMPLHIFNDGPLGTGAVKSGEEGSDTDERISMPKDTKRCLGRSGRIYTREELENQIRN